MQVSSASRIDIVALRRNIMVEGEVLRAGECNVSPGQLTMPGIAIAVYHGSHYDNTERPTKLGIEH
jgi:hypothetical protein